MSYSWGSLLPGWGTALFVAARAHVELLKLRPERTSGAFYLGWLPDDRMALTVVASEMLSADIYGIVNPIVFDLTAVVAPM